ncbi:HEAT repeat domain-containing protein [Maritalea porphyrae]|uniref:HEAT repeat domain-containing protein n=1 Tax=Maritalea porphyrae TaxID=880732 RepID=A0ABQ5UQZ2_9HYPH|nr:HEAT repeat domain-containing protein [Maritalea porphyrae]GLQ17304.1 hypothetical protein GCM10007879_15530 [Maritalea porphyrae]
MKDLIISFPTQAFLQFDPLVLIWNTTLVLAIVSCAVLLILIVRRYFSARRRDFETERRKYLSQLLLHALNSPIDLADDIASQIKASDHMLLIDIALDYVRSMQGEEPRKIVGLVHKWVGIDAFSELLDKTKRGPKIRILTLLSHLSDKPSFDLLFKYGDHAEPYVQLAALQSLAKRCTPDQVGKVLRLVRQTGRTNTTYLADVLTQLGVVAAPQLVQLLDSDVNDSVCVAIIAALGNIGDEAAVEALKARTNSTNSQIRTTIAASLGQIGSKTAATELIKLATDGNDDVRKAAVAALGNLNEPSVLPTIYDALSDPAWWVRYTAGTALVRYGDGGIALLRLMSRQDGPAAINAKQVLAEYQLART